MGAKASLSTLEGLYLSSFTKVICWDNSFPRDIQTNQGQTKVVISPNSPFHPWKPMSLLDFTYRAWVRGDWQKPGWFQNIHTGKSSLSMDNSFPSRTDGTILSNNLPLSISSRTFWDRRPHTIRTNLHTNDWEDCPETRLRVQMTLPTSFFHERM